MRDLLLNKTIPACSDKSYVYIECTFNISSANNNTSPEYLDYPCALPADYSGNNIGLSKVVIVVIFVLTVPLLVCFFFATLCVCYKVSTCPLHKARIKVKYEKL